MKLGLIDLYKAISEADAKRARKGLAVGEHNVDMTVRISGRINVGADEQYIPTISMPWKETAALLLHRMGFQRDAAIAILVEIVGTAIGASGHGQGSIAATMPLFDEALAVVEQRVTSQLPMATRNGKVKASLAVEEITTASVEPKQTQLTLF